MRPLLGPLAGCSMGEGADCVSEKSRSEPHVWEASEGTQPQPGWFAPRAQGKVPQQDTRWPATASAGCLGLPQPRPP